MATLKDELRSELMADVGEKIKTLIDPRITDYEEYYVGIFSITMIDENTFISGSDQLLTIWDIESGEKIKTLSIAKQDNYLMCEQGNAVVMINNMIVSNILNGTVNIRRPAPTLVKSVVQSGGGCGGGGGKGNIFE